MTEPDGRVSIREAARTGTPDDLLQAESAAGQDKNFAQLDLLITEVLQRMFSGRQPVLITHKNRGAQTDQVIVDGLSEEARSVLAEHFDLATQESRGAWYLPQEASLTAGLCNLSAQVISGNPFAVNAARDGNIKVSLRDAPDALAVWALLLPLADTLLAPIQLRTATGKPKTAEQQTKAWAEVETMYRVLELDVAKALTPIRPGSGWSKLRLDDQRAAYREIVAQLATNVSPRTAQLWRAHLVQAIATAFYKKAKKSTPLARAVLSRGLQPAFSTVFAGDWLALLGYLGETPNPGEEIATALPEPRLYVGATSKAEAVAAEQGLPVDEVQRIIAGFLGPSAGSSPIDDRVGAMKQWWGEFDVLWQQQESGMPALWGLVDEGLFVLENPRAPTPYFYRHVLTPGLTAEIDRLWDGVTLPRWPERIVSEFHPHKQMADAFGPAATFWQGVALTTWYVCEGPTSRTTLGALGQYHSRQITALRDAGFPIDPDLFAELARAEHRLGPPQDIPGSIDRDRTGGIEITISVGTRRDGFDILRDIVSDHRRAWTDRYLDEYLHHRWDHELREVAHEHSRRVAARGKPPTIKQFASFAAAAANHWFSGDLGALYAALGEVAPATPQRVDLLAGDPYTFVRTVWSELGGRHLPEHSAWKDRPAFDQQWQIGKLASRSLHYLQLQEALGRTPTPKEFGADRITWNTLGGEEAGWAVYSRVVDDVRLRPLPPTPVQEHAARTTPKPRSTQASAAAAQANTDQQTRRRWFRKS